MTTQFILVSLFCDQQNNLDFKSHSPQVSKADFCTEIGRTITFIVSLLCREGMPAFVVLIRSFFENGNIYKYPLSALGIRCSVPTDSRSERGLGQPAGQALVPRLPLYDYISNIKRFENLGSVRQIAVR